jgi:PAS domain S-box-containing protein
MTGIIENLLDGASIILVFVVFYTLVDNIAEVFGRYLWIVSGIMFGISACLVMLVPFELGQGVIFDARGVILALAPVFGGIGAGALAAILASLMRLHIGGEGTEMGILAIIIAYAVGVVFRILKQRGFARGTLPEFMLLGAVVHGLTVLGFWWTLGAKIAAHVGPMMIMVNTVSTGIVGLLFQIFRNLRRDRLETGLAKQETAAQLAILQTAFQGFPVAIYVLDPDMRIVAVNEQFYRILDYPKERFPLGTSHHDLVAFNKQRGEFVEPEIVDEENSLLSQLDLGLITEYERVRPNGTVLRVRSFPLSEGGFVRTMEDVTQARNEEHEREFWNDQLSAMQDIATAYIVGAAPEEIYESILKSAISLTGSEIGFVGNVCHNEAGVPYLRASAILANTEDASAPCRTEKPGYDNLVFCNLETLFGAAIKTGNAVISNSPMQDSRSGGIPDGHPPLRSFLGLPVFAGERLVAIIGVANNPEGYDDDLPTKLKHYIDSVGLVVSALNDRLAREQAEQDRDEHDLRLDLAVEAASIGLWESNLVDGSVYFSSTWKKQIGFDDASLENRMEAWKDRVHPEDQDATFAALERTLQPPFPHYRVEYRLRHRDGSYRWILAEGNVIFDSSGAPRRLLGVHTDMTEHRQTEEQLRQAQKMEAVGQLTAGLAHDFNNILAIILGNLELMEETITSRINRKLLGTALRSTVRGAELTSQLLAFGRRAPLKPVPFDINDLITELCPLLERSLGSSIQITRELCREEARVSLDKNQLENALVNMAINARDAMPDGGKLKITTRCLDIDEEFSSAWGFEAKPGPYVMVDISDTGIGMDSETASRVFEPFFTTKAHGKGTGLGLSMVYGFLKQSGGHAYINSQSGIGTSVQLFVPAATSTSIRQLPEPPALPSRLDAEPDPHFTILLLEDEDVVRETVRELLESMGMHVLCAREGQDAISMVQEGADYDLLLCDVSLTGPLTGPQTVKLIREIDPTAKALFMSGYPGGEGGCEAIDPADRLLQKPVSRALLKDAILACLG